MRVFLAALVIVVLGSSPTGAGEKKLAGKTVLDLWDAAYLQGARAGYVHSFAEEFERDGHKLIRTTVELRLKLKRFNDNIELGMDSGDIATPDGKVVATFMRQTLGSGKKLEITGLVTGEQLRLTRDGTQPLVPAPWNESAVGTLKQQTILKDRAVKAGDRFDFTAFEPSVNLLVSRQVDVKGMEEVELPGTKKKVRLLRAESRPERLQGVQLPILVTWLDKNLDPVLSETELPFGTFRMVRTTKGAARSPGVAAELTDIGLTQLVRLKQPISAPYETTSATYRIAIREDADPSSAFARDGRQEVLNVQGNTFELQVRANPKQPEKETKKPGLEFTQSSYFINSDDPRVRQLAARAVGDQTEPWTQALRIERWVHDHMKVTSDEALATADHVARTLQGDCTEFAMLTAAMCRAEGIPSRTAVGLIYANVRNQPAFAFHMWTEVWIDGEWRSLDATLGKGRISATHLKINAQSWHEARDMTPLFPVVRVVGRIRIEVLNVK